MPRSVALASSDWNSSDDASSSGAAVSAKLLRNMVAYGSRDVSAIIRQFGEAQRRRNPPAAACVVAVFPATAWLECGCVLAPLIRDLAIRDHASLNATYQDRSAPHEPRVHWRYSSELARRRGWSCRLANPSQGCRIAR